MAAGTDSKPKHPIGSVDNALRLLTMFRDRKRIRVSEASDALGVGRSTAHRLMAMLQYYGFVTQDPVTKSYASGPALVDIGLSAVRGIDIRSYARPYLERAVAAIDETSHLLVLEGTDVLFLDGVESGRPVRSGTRTGLRCPAHATAAGKMMLSLLPPPRVHELYPSPQLESRTPKTIKTRAALEDELDRIRKQGWAEAAGENEPEIAAVAVPIGDRTLGLEGAISYAVPISRWDERTRRKLVKELLEITAVPREKLTSA
jgi:IclR family acetate operon transcriptional repressor